MSCDGSLLQRVVERAGGRANDMRFPFRPIKCRKYGEQIAFGPTDFGDAMDVQDPSGHYLHSADIIRRLVVSHSFAYLANVYMLANTHKMSPRTPSRNPCLRT